MDGAAVMRSSGVTSGECMTFPIIEAHDVADRHGHTESDGAELFAAGVDPATTQPRDHAVRCICGATTFNQLGYCDRPECYRPPTAVVRARVDLARQDISFERRPSVKAAAEAHEAAVRAARVWCDDHGIDWRQS